MQGNKCTACTLFEGSASAWLSLPLTHSTSRSLFVSHHSLIMLSSLLPLLFPVTPEPWRVVTVERDIEKTLFFSPCSYWSSLFCAHLGQSHGELETMEKDVEKTLASGEGDMDYWDAVLRRLKIQKVGIVCLSWCKRIDAGVHPCCCAKPGAVMPQELCASMPSSHALKQTSPTLLDAPEAKAHVHELQSQIVSSTPPIHILTLQLLMLCTTGKSARA